MTSPLSNILHARRHQWAWVLVMPLLGVAGCASEPPSPLVVIEDEGSAAAPVVLGPTASERLVGAFVHRATVAGVEGEWGLRWNGNALTRYRDGLETGADTCEILSDGPQRVVLMCRSEAGQETRRPWVFDGEELIDELSRLRFERDESVVVEPYVEPATEGSSLPPQ